MSGTLRISICDPDETSKENLKRYLVGMDQVWLEADCARYDFFKEIVDQTTPDVALIAIDSDEERALELIAEVKACLLYTSPSPRDQRGSRMPSSA